LVWLRNPPTTSDSMEAVAWHEAGHPFIVCRKRPGEKLSLGFCLPKPLGQSGSPIRIAAHSDEANVARVDRPPALCSEAAQRAIPRDIFTRKQFLDRINKMDKIPERRVSETLLSTAHAACFHPVNLVNPVEAPQSPNLGLNKLLSPPIGCIVRLIGSRMWEAITGTPYTNASSDLDLVIDLATSDAADPACEFLGSFTSPIRLDAELSFPGRKEVHWKEWKSAADPLLVKSLDAVALVPRAELRQG
jgi:hypothetical protein